MTDEPEVPFDEPWQARAFALVQALIDQGRVDREDFRSQLIEEVAAEPDRPYWESWLAALEVLVPTLTK